VAAGAKSRAGYDLVAGDGRGEVELTLTAAAGEGHTDRVVRSVEVVPRGYSLEIAKGGMIEGEQTVIPVLLPADLDRSSLAGELTIYPNTLTTLADGLESMLRRPCGCFEQTSSANYPNVMILSLLERSGEAAPAAAARARSLLDDGYRKLTTFECPGRGYEWFGRDPANPALTAYGLLEFTDMARVHRVDPEMLARTRRWLLEGRDGAGGFRFGTGRALDSFGAAPHGVTKAYVLWALTEADAKTDLGPELRALRDEARASEDPYFLALSALALGNRGDPATAGLTRRLAELQKGDGGLVGTTTSITSSRGSNLEVETTALAAIAFLRDPAERGAGESAIRYLVSKRRGGGGFGATQATILALRALLEQARHAAKTESEMDLTLFVNNRVAGHGHVHPGMRRPVVFSRELLDDLEEGGSEIMVRAEGEGSLPFALSLRYHTRVPPTDAGCAVGVATALDREQAREGESVGLSVTLTNREKGAVPMTLARVGLPAGLTPRIEALRELVKSGAIDSYEVRPREVALYLRGMAPSETKTVNLDLTAEFPGDFEGPATSAYLYYTDTQKSWAAPLRIRIAE
jgi:hypothetical protein